MSAVATLPRGAVGSRSRRPAVVRALAWTELRRTLRNPLLPIGLGLSVWYLWDITPANEAWSGAAYQGMSIMSAYLMLTISFVTATSFNRERKLVVPGTPVPPGTRTVARLVAAAPMVVLAAAYAAFSGWRQRDLGGFALGAEPGRTAEAVQTVAELSQHVALAVLAVALGAAVGRRVSRLAATIPLLFMFWFLVGSLYWLYQDPMVVPLSVIQVQPVAVPAGPGSTDPLTFPQTWLLEPPDEWHSGWVRLYVSTALAWWHCVWLLGLSSLLLAAVSPRGRGRRWLLVGGVLVAALGLVAQFRVIP